MAANVPGTSALIAEVAEILVGRFGDDAEFRAGLVAYALHESGDTEQAYVWMKVCWAVAELRRRRSD
jgi:hypothetical protein